MSMNVSKEEPGGAADYSKGLGRYVVVYCMILVLAGLQFVVAYQHLDVSAMLLRMFSIALVEAGLAVMFFMHLGSEDRKFTISVVVFVVFVLGAMQYSWTDSFRMERNAPPVYQVGPPR
jgi:caa(3)-type oxidase subunit IV